MANDVFRAIDASLVIGVDDTSSPEGAAADGLVAQYDLSNAVGRLRNVQVTVSSDVKPFYEIGRRYPTHLRPGVIRTSGTADRETGFATKYSTSVNTAFGAVDSNNKHCKTSGLMALQ